MLTLVALASAAPRFVSTEPSTVALAQAAWEGATACAGWAPDIPEVQVVFDLPALGDAGLAGLARFEAGKPGKIRLAPGSSALTVAHEVSHAWVNRGPSALVEGRTEVLAHCIQRRMPDTFRGLQDRTSDLAYMPDLTTWQEQVGGIDAELDAYLGSFRLFRALAEVVPPERLWAKELDSWAALDALLAGAGERGAEALAVLHGGVDAQRVALRDDDLDGLPALHERFVGTDPARRDTDGDGWWDGAPPHLANAIALPTTRRPVCLPFVPEGKDTITVRAGGALGGLPIPEVLGMQVAAGGLVTWEAGWQRYPGGVWVVAVGDALVPNPRCAMRGDLVVRSVDAAPAGSVAALADAVVAGRAAIAGLGIASPPLLISVEGDKTYADVLGTELHVPKRVLDEPAGFGASIAALAATASIPAAGRAAAAAAIAKSARPEARLGLLQAAGYEIAAWNAAARRCESGWKGLLAGTCERPD